LCNGLCSLYLKPEVELFEVFRKSCGCFRIMRCLVVGMEQSQCGDFTAKGVISASDIFDRNRFACHFRHHCGSLGDCVGGAEDLVVGHGCISKSGCCLDEFIIRNFFLTVKKKFERNVIEMLFCLHVVTNIFCVSLVFVSPVFRY